MKRWKPLIQCDSKVSSQNPACKLITPKYKCYHRLPSYEQYFGSGNSVNVRINKQLPKMRVLLTAALCFSMIGYIMADDMVMGERKEGDYSCANRTVFKPAIPWKPMRAVIGMKTPNSYEIINYVNFSSAGNSPDYIVTKGGIGSNNLTIMALSKAGEGMSIRVQGYCFDPTATTTTDAPTTSKPLPTTAEPEPPTEIPTETTAKPEPPTEATTVNPEPPTEATTVKPEPPTEIPTETTTAESETTIENTTE